MQFRQLRKVSMLFLSFLILWTVPQWSVSAPGKAHANEKDLNIESFTQQVPKKRNEKVELIDKRTANSKRWLNPDGSFTEEIAMRNIHYKKNGKFEDIDNNLTPITDPKYKFKNKANQFDVKFADSSSNDKFILFSEGSASLEMKPVGFKTKNAVVNGNKVQYQTDSTETVTPVGLEYNVDNNGLKEDIVLDQYHPVNLISFAVNLNGVTYKTEKDGSIGFYDVNTKKKRWYINRAYMEDNAQAHSDAVTMTARVQGSQLFIDIVPDDTWLKAADRVYPVRIDPTILLYNDGQDTFVSKNNPNTNYSTATYLSAGYDSASLGLTQSYVWFTLPVLPAGSYVQGGTLKLYQYGSVTPGSNTVIQAYRATSDWAAETLKWSNNNVTTVATPETLTSSPTGAGWYNFDVKSAVDSWYNKGANNFGFVIKASTDTSERRLFYAFNYTNNVDLTPRIYLDYIVNPLGYEDHWTYQTDVNVANGNLTFTNSDVTVPGRIATSVSRTYNSRSSYEGIFGYGWFSSLEARIYPVDRGNILYIDADRTLHTFEQSGTSYIAPPGVDVDLVKNVDGTYKMTDKVGTAYNFSSAGNLTSITDANNNTLTYVYGTSGKVESIKDPAGRVTATIQYNANGKVSSVTDLANHVTTYSYTGNDLTQVTQASGTAEVVTIRYEYDTSHNLISITDPKGYKTYYYYTTDPQNPDKDDRVQSVNPNNKIQNASFEVDSDGDTYHVPDRWSYNSGQTNATGVDGVGVQGTRSLKMTVSSQYSVYFSDSIPVNRTLNYTLSGMIKATQTSGTLNTVLSVIAFDSANTNLGEFGKITQPGTVITWKSVNATIAANTLPVGTSYVKVKTAISNTTGASSSWFDALQLEEGTTASSFIGPFTHTVNPPTMNSAFYDENGRKVFYAYNENGNIAEETLDPISQSNPAGQNLKTTYTYAKDSATKRMNNEIESITDPKTNKQLTNLYDAGSGNLTSSTLADNTTFNYEYDNQNNLIASTDGTIGSSNKTNYFYDNLHNWLGSKDPLNRQSAVSYNKGNLTDDYRTMTAGENLLLNASFEEDANQDSWPDSWNSPAIAGAASVTWGYDAEFGSRGLTFSGITAGSTAIVTSADVAVVPASQFTLSAYFKGSTADAAKATKIRLEAMDSNHAVISSFTQGNVAIGEVNAWNRLQISPNQALPEQTAFVHVVIEVGANTGTVNFDGVQLENSFVISAYNLIGNSSFERGSSTPDEWKYVQGSGLSIDTAQMDSGKRSVTVSNPLSAIQYAPVSDIAIQSGKGYSFTGLIKSQSSVIPNVDLKINFYDANHQLISSIMGDKPSTIPMGWVRLSVTSAADQVPNGAVFALPVIEINPFNGTIWLDSFRMQEGSIKSSFKYDTNNTYITQVLDELGRVTTIDSDTEGNPLFVTDAKNNKTSYTYDLFDRLKSVQLPGVNLKTNYSYDLNGNLTSTSYQSTDGLTTYSSKTNVYNKNDQLVSSTDGVGETTTYEYEAGSNLVKVSYQNGNKVEFGYDSANRLNSIKYNGVLKYSYEYDANSNITRITDKITNKTWTYTPDTLDRLQEQTAPDNSKLSIQYVPNSDARSSITVSAGTTSFKTIFHYGISNLPTEVVDHNQNLSRFAYDEEGNLTQLQFGNGTQLQQLYNEAGETLKMVNTNSNGEVLSSSAYQYDDNGNRIQVINEIGQKITYTYDSLNQLLSETNPKDGTTISYSYDVLGNRTKKEIKDSAGNVVNTFSYSYDKANKLLSVNGQAYTYETMTGSGDKAGNLIQDNKLKYKWDESGRLFEVRNKVDDALLGQYEYDDTGRRVKSTVNGVVTNYHYDGNSIKVLYETDANGNVTKLYTYSTDGVLLSMTITGQGTYYYQYNGHGDIVALTDQNQEIVASYEYDAYGNVLSNTGSLANSNPYRYAGYRYDTESGLYYLMARYYNADTGRFLSEDTYEGDLISPLSQNQHTYVINNPLKYDDHSGKCVWDLCIGETAAAIWVAGAIGTAVAAGVSAALSLDHAGYNLFATKKSKTNTTQKERDPNPPAKRKNFSSKKDAYEAAKKAGNGREPRLDGPKDAKGPHYHPDVPVPKGPKTPKMNTPHDHYYFPRSQW
ncbi:DNRLRE domain-containing protein [Cohnella candidum]|uniref:DNRLRE domain-containing protein n=1 Tax=Cohnella candidum TaxID=2674991 RepID=A0A3G3JW06_9BACL|nr:DNRLRE domain-containing protein [Cohnella candidum]AYQ72418.1 DNRLRE domain-containing protein [Cohnella candidum]